MDEETLAGTVTSVDARGATVDLGGEALFCRVRGRFYEDLGGQSRPIAPGDRVRVSRISPGEGAVEKIEPRRTKLSRISADGEAEQVIAANVDRVAIVVATKRPPLRSGLIDRLVIAARNHGVEPFVVVNKVDLGRQDLVAEVQRTYEELSFEVLTTSAKEGRGIDRLRAALEGRTTVLVGHSGVGKSSLLNSISPHLDRKVGEVSRHTTKGRHTTTRTELLPLPGGGYVIDTPGVRAFGIFDVTRADLDIFFSEFESLIENCRFYDCMHSHEPDCAVRSAADAGTISSARYRAYLRILSTLEE